MSHQFFIEKSCKLAVESVEKGCGPFGCVIVDSHNNIVAEEHNQVTKLNDPTAHAEIQAIRMACKKLNTYDLSDYKLYTSCEPCPMCLSAIYWSRIKDVYFSNTRSDAKKIGFSDDYIYDELKKEITERDIKLVRVKSDNSLSSFEMWEEKSDKQAY